MPSTRDAKRSRICAPFAVVIRSSLAAAAILTLTWTPATAAPADAGVDLPVRQGRVSPPRRGDVGGLRGRLKMASETQLARYSPLFAWNSPKVCSFGSSAASPGAVTRESNTFGSDPKPAIVTTWEYDRLRNITAQVMTFYGFDGTGPPAPDRTECIYAQGGDLVKGRLLRMTVTRHDGRTNTYRASYDAGDRRVLEIEETDSEGDGRPDTIESTRYSYDAAGRLVRQDYELDFRADGVVDIRSTTNATYDARNRVQRLVLGYYDGPGGSFLPHTTFAVTFDDAARSVVATNEMDYDRDGVTDLTIRYTTLADAAWRLLRATYEVDYYGRADGGGDGTFDSLLDDRYEYDASGYLVRNVLDNVADGVLNSHDDYGFINDRHGRVVQTVYLSETYPGAGEPPQSATEITTHLRDEHGRVVDEVRYTAALRSGSRTQYVYDPLGNLLEQVDSRWWNDEAPMIDLRTTYEYGVGRSGQLGSDSD